MRNKIEKYLLILFVFAYLVANTTYSYAQDGIQGFTFTTEDFGFQEVPATDSGSSDKADDLGDQSELLERLSTEQQNNLVKQDIFLSRLKDELNLSKTDYRQVLTSVSSTKDKLKAVTEERITLKNQLENIDAQINETTYKLITVIKEIIERENKIALLVEQMEMREVAIKMHKELLRDYVRIIYEEENEYFTIDSDGEINAFKLLLADGSVGDNLSELKYFDLLNEAGQQIADKLLDLSTQLHEDQRKLNRERNQFESSKKELLKEKEQLDIQRESKENLIRLTYGQEDIYSQLLEQSMQQQTQLLSDIKNLANAVTFVEDKIAEEGANFNPDRYKSLLDYKTQVLYEFQYTYSGLFNEGFEWPVSPERGINAWFHQASYVNVFGVQHNAIDIAAYQGSLVRAAADAVVFTTRDNGYGYSYIILAHADGFMTVYGHISNILVEEGQTISQGSVIGLSGGMPGTKGAGYMTTGPHLHFEVLLNGLYVDPMYYMPLEVIPEEKIMKLPEKYQELWNEQVYESELEAIER